MKRLNLVIAFLFASLFAGFVFGYDNFIIHPKLSSVAIEVYKKVYPDKLTGQKESWIVAGAIAEDADPRYINHFYDPTTGKGLGAPSSVPVKEWAQYQGGASAITGDYSESAILSNYRSGNFERAYQGVGHMLHLVQDMSVPAHTRLDSHPEGDPYEAWAAKNGAVSASGISLTSINGLNQAFDVLSRYSHDSFFSKDTIKVKDSPKRENGYILCLDEGVLFKCAKEIVEPQKTSYYIDDVVNSDYWNLLSPKAISYSAGVIEYFQNKFDAIDAEKKVEQKLSIFQKTINVVSRATQSTKYVFGDVVIVWQTRIVIAKEVVSQALSVVAPVFAFIGDPGQFVLESVSGKIPLVVVEVASAPADSNSASVILATTPTTQSVTAPVISPTPSDPANNNPTPANTVTQKTVSVPVFVEVPPQEAITPAKPEQSPIPKLIFVGVQNAPMVFGGGVTPEVLGASSGAETVVEETASSTPEILLPTDTATSTATTTLSAPLLAVHQCAASLATDGCLLATTTVRLAWSAVSGAVHYEIERSGVIATTTETFAEIVVPDFSDHAFVVSAVDAGGYAGATSTQEVSVATIPIAINEIAWMGTMASPNDEWFEIKNNTTHTIDLTQWELNAKDGTPHVKLAGEIAPRGYLVFERTDDTAVSDVAAHQTYTGALGNAGEQLNLSYASTTLDQTPEVTNGAWVAGENSTTTKKTMERYSSREDGADPANWGTNLGDARTAQQRHDCYLALSLERQNISECFTQGFVKNGTDADGNLIAGTPGQRNSVSYLINKGQDITSDLTLSGEDGPYFIPQGEEVRVLASSTLTIEGGVTISFYDNLWDQKSIVVDGVINAQGTADNPVVINSLSQGGPMGNIYLYGTEATSTLSHVLVEGIDTVHVLDGASLEVRDSQFVANGRDIIGVDASVIVVKDTTFINSEDGAINVVGDTLVSVSSTTIKNTIDGPAISVGGGAHLDMDNVLIDGAYDWANSGVYVAEATASITNSVIRNTEASGVEGFFADVSISSSTIESTNSDALHFYISTSTISNTNINNVSYGCGVSAYRSDVVVADSTIKDVADCGVGAWGSSLLVASTTISNGGGSGVHIFGGEAEITDTVVSGFVNGAGVEVNSFIEDTWDNQGNNITITSPANPVMIDGGEIKENATGIVALEESSSVVISDSVSVHDNGTSPADDIVVVVPPVQ